MTPCHTVRNPSHGLPPPGRLSNHPAKPSPARIPKLRQRAVKRHAWRVRKRAPQKHAPEFVPSMTMVVPYFVPNLAGVVVTDGDDGRKKHVVTRRHTLKRVVRLFIHVKKTGFKARQLKISRSAQDRSGIGKRTCQMFRAEICLRQRFGIFVCSLRKMQDRKLRMVFKDWDKSGNSIELLRITVVIQSQHQISARLMHHPITGSNGTSR